MNSNIIYALKCPITGDVHYIGKSKRGLIRPFSHLSISHSDKIREWVSDLSLINNKPVVSVIEEVNDESDLDAKERYWINYYLNKGCHLLNSVLVSPVMINPKIVYTELNKKVSDIILIGEAVKKRRKDLGLNQSELAEKAGVALTVVRKIEQGKENFNFESLISILSLLGLSISLKNT